MKELKPHIAINNRGYWDVRISVAVLLSDVWTNPEFIARLQAAQSFVWRMNTLSGPPFPP